jgi:hypothetical protein
MIAFEEYAYAILEGKQDDVKYVRDKSYERYESELKQEVSRNINDV